MTVTSELEAKIGPRPLSRPITFEQVAHLRTWLIAQGVASQRANTAGQDAIIAAYNNSTYLNKMRSGGGRARSSDKWAEAYDFSQDEPSTVEPPLGASSDVPFGSVTTKAPAEAGGGAITATAAEIARAADAVISTRLAAAMREMELKAESAIDKRLKNANLVLSDADKEKIRTLARDEARSSFEQWLPPRRIEIKDAQTGELRDLGVQHFKFDILLRACGIRLPNGFRPNIWLTGPTGSGKTTAAEHIAKALKMEFGADSSLDADFKVMGFMNAQGQYVETEFYRRFTQGGMYVMDEVDVWFASAILAMNAPLANGWCSFPCGMRKRHPDFIVIACANTWGQGATNDYVGRNKLDAATIDRFGVKIDWPIDESLEHAVASSLGGDRWCKVVQGYRLRAKERGIKIIISPRATFNGTALLAAGFSEADVIDMTFAAGLKDEQRDGLGIPKASAAQSATLGAGASGSRGLTKLTAFQAALADARMIEAIKIWRDVTGADLSSAKQAVEQIRDGYRSMPSAAALSAWNVPLTQQVSG